MKKDKLLNILQDFAFEMYLFKRIMLYLFFVYFCSLYKRIQLKHSANKQNDISWELITGCIKEFFYLE